LRPWPVTASLVSRGTRRRRLGHQCPAQRRPAVAVDGSGNLYIADSLNYVIRKVTAATGIITTVAGNGLPGYSGDGGVATSARIAVGLGIAVDGSGNIYFSDGVVVRKVTAATGIITVVAGNGSSGYSGDGGPATSARLANPTGVAVDAPATSTSPTVRPTWFAR